MPSPRLRPLHPDDERAVRAAQLELAADSFQFAGHTSIRHRLNDRLLAEDGHIGEGVRTTDLRRRQRRVARP